jgi:hypothetical protein
MRLNDCALGLQAVATEAFNAGGGRDVSRLIESLQSADAHVLPAHIPALIVQLASLQAMLAARLPQASGSETVYLTLKQLARRTGLGQSTLRAMRVKGFEEGVHFIRNGRRLLFIWPAVDAQIRALLAGVSQQAPEVLQPFVRRGRRRG